MQRENDSLQAQLRSTFILILETKLEIKNFMINKKEDEFQNRQTRAISVQNVKEKLVAANAQIVNLLKDKIALNEKISQINEKK